MRLAVFGSTGQTGMELVKQALAADHNVTAFLRHINTIFIRIIIVNISHIIQKSGSHNETIILFIIYSKNMAFFVVRNSLLILKFWNNDTLVTDP